MNENDKRVFIDTAIHELKRDLTIAAKFTKALSDSIENGIDSGCTLEGLQTLEFISEEIRRTISSPAIFRAICNLTDAGILDAEEMEKLGICEKVKGSK